MSGIEKCTLYYQIQQCSHIYLSDMNVFYCLFAARQHKTEILGCSIEERQFKKKKRLHKEIQTSSESFGK